GRRRAQPLPAGRRGAARHWSEAMSSRRLAACYAVLSAVSLTGCGEPAECASPDYRRAECRILAEREFSRLRTSTGLEVRMQEPGADSAEQWAVTGLVRERGGQVAIRVATLGPFSV